mgnify:CR=1 FL=1
MWPVRNKTIIGLKYETWNLKTEDINNVRNKTIIGLKCILWIYRNS